MLRAGNADELDEAMRAWVDPCNNLVDRRRPRHHRLPHARRDAGARRANAWLPVPGWTGAHEW